MTDERLIGLETRLTYQEDLIEELNKTVFQQQQKIEHLELTYHALLDRTKALSEEITGRQVIDEKPPHY